MDVGDCGAGDGGSTVMGSGEACVGSGMVDSCGVSKIRNGEDP